MLAVRQQKPIVKNITWSMTRDSVFSSFLTKRSLDSSDKAIVRNRDNRRLPATGLVAFDSVQLPSDSFSPDDGDPHHFDARATKETLARCTGRVAPG